LLSIKLYRLSLYFSVKELDLKSLSVAILALALPLASHASRLVFPEGSVKSVSKNGSSLQNVSDALNLNLNAGNYALVETKESLLGKHEYYQQMVNGVAVDGAEVVVSTNNNGEVVKVYNNGVKSFQKSFKASIPLVSESQALESAWKHLKVNGELLDAPIAKLVYTRELALVYKISLSTSSPAGHFDVTVDANTGLVVEAKDAALPRMKRASAPVRLKGKAAFSSLSEAQASLEVKAISKSMELAGITVKGTAQVFDPNPVVTLGRTDLQDTSPLSVFTQAYTNEDLLDITMADGVYSLKGPKITLIDFETPTMAPSTSTDGSWVFERTNPKFNDAMTYVHIDRSIRYIESLGFNKKKVIFPKSIEVDSNGVQGADNSHYIPSSRRLAFGNGCVDDNEDADVILHELGHAIQHHINSAWSGGDTGAMGEGFGDYWAASYSVTTPHGMEGNLNWVFKWDGHNKCWPGRKLDSFTPAYNPASRYGAHASVNGGVSDELWSTPIFQAFLELYKSGVPRADIDKIILESHFGLGSGVKMPDMAKSIVKTAKALFPTKDYDQVYTRHFQKVKIL
jgi:hypothetical protein